MAVRAEPKERSRLPLSRGRILSAAIALADKDGIESLSMRKLGRALGVEAMSLYKHVANKEDLLDGMVDIVVGEIDPPRTDIDWKSSVRLRILSARSSLLRHPWASRAIESRTNPTPTVLEYMDSMIGMFRRGGFSIDLTHHAMHVMGSRLLGFSQELFDDSESFGPEFEAMLEQIADTYPYIAELAEAVTHDESSTVGQGCDDQFEFEFALDLVLDGLERLRAAE
jgi:AcrR family transcriptional regulator